MKERKNTDTQVRELYEQLEVKLLNVTPQGVLCQSGVNKSMEETYYGTGGFEEDK